MVGNRELVLNKGSHQLPGDRVAKCGGCASCDVLESRARDLCLPSPPLPASTLCFSLMLSPSSLCLPPARGRWWDGCEVPERDGYGLRVLLLPPLFFLSCSSPFSLLSSSSSPFLLFLSSLFLSSSRPFISYSLPLPLLPFSLPPSFSPMFSFFLLSSLLRAYPH